MYPALGEDSDLWGLQTSLAGGCGVFVVVVEPSILENHYKRYQVQWNSFPTVLHSGTLQSHNI